MTEKSWEFWAVLVGVGMWMMQRDYGKETLPKLVTKVAGSGLLAFGLAPTVAPYVRDNETAAAVLVMAFGLVLLDVLTAAVSDRDLIADIIRAKLGGKRDDGK